MSSAESALCLMPSPQTDPAARRPEAPAPGGPLVPFGPRKARFSHALLLAVSGLTILGALIEIPVVRALFPAVLNSVAPVMVRAVVIHAPAAAPVAPQKTTACTHKCVQAGPSHRHVCS